MPTTAAEHCVHHRDLASALAPGDTLTRAPVWARWYLAPSMLTFGPGVSRELVSAECDTVLYVQEGSGTLRLGGERHEIGPGLAAFAAAGQPWSVENPGSEPVVMAEVLVPDPEPAGAPYAAVRLDGSADDEATGGRSFRLLCTPAQGCNSVTQFVGYDTSLNTTAIVNGSPITLPFPVPIISNRSIESRVLAARAVGACRGRSLGADGPGLASGGRPGPPRPR